MTTDITEDEVDMRICNFLGMKLYVSGGMTGKPSFNFPLFDEVEDTLWKRGANNVRSPAQNDRNVARSHGISDITLVDGFAEGDVSRYEAALFTDGDTHKVLFRWDFNIIVNECTGIVMLPGWESSTGAKWERTIAEAMGLDIIVAKYEQPGGLGQWEFYLDSDQQRLTNFLKHFNDEVVWLPRESYDYPTTAEVAAGGQLIGSGYNKLVIQPTPLHEHIETLETRVVDPTTGGAKGSKIEAFDLIPYEPLRWLAELYGRGAMKYAPRNWQKGYAWSLSFAAMQRHAWAFWSGEDIIPQNAAGDDPTAGVPHLTAVAWHAFALLEWMTTHTELDDRPR